MRLAVLLLAGWSAAVAAGDGVPLWSVRGQAGTVQVLGSVHLLKQTDYPLPEAVTRAYEDADALVMELDLDDLDVASVTAGMLELGASGSGPTVRSVLGEADWERARQEASAAGLDLEMIAEAEPWLVALMIHNLALGRAGFDPALGVEQHLAARAMADGKPVEGLETLSDQLGLFDSLEPGIQGQLLEQTLDSLDELAVEAEQLVAAWRSGDLETLEARFAEDFADYPELEHKLVCDRNRAWMPSIEARLSRPGNSLVVVGALHTVGACGLPSLLEDRGYEVLRR